VGVDFSTLEEREVIDDVRARRQGPFSYFVTPNVDHIVTLHGQGAVKLADEFRLAYQDAALCLCDSRIVQRIAAIRGVRLPLVTGSDLTVRLFREVLTADDRIAVIGGQESSLVLLRALYPDLSIVQHLPPMGAIGNPQAIQDIVRFIQDKRPTVTLFAIGAPQSEIIARQVSRAAGTTGIALCVGASIEFLTGEKKRAPRWMQSMGLEWAFRLLSEPRRLWKRYLYYGPRIFLIAWRTRGEKG
jgi:exopolysaccharide biosynthesis WecB/TagA/CpsF family protein